MDMSFIHPALIGMQSNEAKERILADTQKASENNDGGGEGGIKSPCPCFGESVQPRSDTRAPHRENR